MWNLLKLIETLYMKFHETSEIISRFEKTWNFLSLPPLKSYLVLLVKYRK